MFQQPSRSKSRAVAPGTGSDFIAELAITGRGRPQRGMAYGDRSAYEASCRLESRFDRSVPVQVPDLSQFLTALDDLVDSGERGLAPLQVLIAGVDVGLLGERRVVVGRPTC
jgi:hypothetical protein